MPTTTETEKVLRLSSLAKSPITIPTPWRGVAVFGHELISKKEVAILAHCLNREEFGPDQGDHGVAMVLFRDDDRPCGVQAICVPDAMAIVINLERVWEKAVDEVIENTEESLFSAFHRNLVLDFLHEIHHMVILQSEGGVPEDADRREELENAAEQWAFKELMSMAKELDIEPPHPHESAFLNKRLCELQSVNHGAFEKEQMEMAENRVMYHLPEDGKGGQALTLMSFKAVMHLLSDDAVDDPEWNKAIAVPTAAPVAPPAAASPVAQPAAPNTAPDPAPFAPAETSGLFPEDISPAEGFDGEYLEIPEPSFCGGEATENQEMGLFEAFAADAAANFVPKATPPPITAAFPVANPEVFPPMPASMVPPVTAPVPAAPEVHHTTQMTGRPMVYPQTGLSPEQTRDVVFSVLNKIYYHIFSNCGRMLNSDMGFSNPEAVCTKPIALTEDELRVVVKCDCLDVNGRWCPNMPTTMGLRGFIMKNTKLPAYKLYINNGGYEAVRLILPQNPGKTGSGGEYTKPALQARGGTCIAYVLDGVDKMPHEKSTFLFKCVDGQWQSCSQ